MISEAFWPFKQPCYLLDCVCDKCNGYFGRGIEQALARDSVEGLLRVPFGLKPKNKRRRLGGQRLGITVTERGDWNGVRVFADRDSTGKNCTVRPLPQVFLRKKGDSEWKRYAESELNAEVVKPYATEPEALVFGLPDEIPRLQEKLVGLGVKPKDWVYEPRDGQAKTPVFVNSLCDEIILRAVAKIAFNFLAYTQGADFALETDFDCIRNYVKYGSMASTAPVQVLTVSIQGGGNVLRPRHAVVLNWDAHNRGLACLVTLFGYMVYQVTLCEKYSGLWRPLSVGRIFNLQKRMISEIPGLNLAPLDAWAQLFWNDGLAGDAEFGVATTSLFMSSPRLDRTGEVAK